MRRRTTAAILIVIGTCAVQTVCCDAEAMGTAFTYQGRFIDDGSPADDTYDLEFKLYDALTSGTQQGSTVYTGDVEVSDGYFTVTLDFGATAFKGDARWLQIGVRPGESTGAYTTLTPRHELTPSVYALRTAGIAVSDDNVGIGTSTPVSRLSVVDSSLPVLSIYNSADNQFEGGRIRFLETPATTFLGGYLHYDGSNNVFNIGVHGVGNKSLANDVNAVSIKRVNGFVGIATTSPYYRLDVNGDVRCVDLLETSDGQLKTQVQPLEGVLGKLDRVRAVSFQWNEKARSLGAESGKKQIGVLAQELEQVFPELVTTPTPTTADELLRSYPEEMVTPEVKQRLERDAERSRYKAVSYSKLTVILLEAVKELQEKNASLERRLQALESRSQ